MTESAPGIAPSDLVVGMDVDVVSRTWAGINRPGGHATVVSVRYSDVTGAAVGVDVRYVLGGRERDLELMYVRAHVELARGSRGRRRDEKMNLSSLGRGEEQGRTAGGGDDGGGNKRRKKGGEGGEGGGEKKAKAGDGEGGTTKKEKAGGAVKRTGGGGGGRRRRALASIDGNGGGVLGALSSAPAEADGGGGGATNAVPEEGGDGAGTRALALIRVSCRVF